ncbi:MAG: hypothetical protein PHW92_09210 [Lutibacter sp.]|nr:hypothetical protein [Lutibacter sp.]
MSFEDEEKRKQKMKMVKISGTIMAIGFMIFGAYLEQLGPLIGLSQSFYASAIIKYIFIAMGIMDLIVFTFVFK